MNNKFIARIAAVAIGATMLSTAVFASAGVTLGDDKDKLNFTGTTSSDTYVTMMAYATDTDLTDANVGENSYSDGDVMIALEQVAGTTGLDDTVKIDSSKLSGKKNIVVKIGGDTSATSFLLKNITDFVTILDGETVNDEQVVIDDTTYTGIRTKTSKYQPASGENVSEVGVVFTRTDRKDDVTTTDGDTNIVVKWDGTIDGEGEISFGAGLIGVPTNKTVYAFPYVKGTK